MFALVACAPCVDPNSSMFWGALALGALGAVFGWLPALSFVAGIADAVAARREREGVKPYVHPGGSFQIDNDEVGTWDPSGPVPEWIAAMEKDPDVIDKWRAKRVDEALRNLPPEGRGIPVGRDEDTKAVYGPEVMEQTQQLLDEIAVENRLKRMLDGKDL